MYFDEEDNVHDRNPVAVTCSGGFVVGHLLHEISSLFRLFISALASCVWAKAAMTLTLPLTLTAMLKQWLILTEIDLCLVITSLITLTHSGGGGGSLHPAI